MKTKKYKFKAKIWKYEGKGGWHFVTLPKSLSKIIRKNHGSSEEGWGRLKAIATVGKSQWSSAIWYDTKFQSYLLPVKATVRKSEKIVAGDVLSLELAIEESGLFGFVSKMRT